MSSVFDWLQDGVVTKISELGLSLGGSPVTVQKRKLPTSQEALDVLPLIAVTGAENPGKREPFQTAGEDSVPTVLVENLIQVTIISPGNFDPISNLRTYAEWHQRICRLFGNPVSLPDVPELMTTWVEPKIHLNREAYNLNYDYLALQLRFETVEPAT